MNESIRNRLLSFSSIAIIFGSAGFISALVTMFVNVSDNVSMKWIVFLCWVFSTILAILCKLINDLIKPEVTASPNFYAKPFNMLLKENTFLIYPNDAFTYNILVECYCIDENGIEKLVFIGRVTNIQKKFVQIKTFQEMGDTEIELLINGRGLNCVIIKPSVSYESFKSFEGLLNE